MFLRLNRLLLQLELIYYFFLRFRLILPLPYRLKEFLLQLALLVGGCLVLIGGISFSRAIHSFRRIHSFILVDVEVSF